jgi:hypothetical protein
MMTLKEEISRVVAGEPQHFRNLTLMPLFRHDVHTAEPEYLLLEEAISRALAQVTEIGAGGSVPELRFESRAEQPTLLLDGEELVGAKQNRVLNLSVLAPPHATIIIPVSCVESGRWRQDTPSFRPGDHVMYARGRAARAGQVTESMRLDGTRRSDQSAVWEQLHTKAERMEGASPTRAMDAIFTRHAYSVEEYLRSFSCAEGQAGMLFALGGVPVGLDLFDHPATLRRLFPKLVRSYALDALDEAGEKPEPAEKAKMLAWMETLAAAPAFSQPGVGLGKDVRFQGLGVSGAGLWALERYIHLCAFATQGQPGPYGFQTRLSSPRRRAGR